MKRLRSLMCLVFLLAVSFDSQASCARSGLAQVYAAIFGNHNVRVVNQQAMLQALTDFGVADAKSVPVKKMNSVARQIMGSGTVSFTLEGIWLDEDLLDTLSDDIRDFIFYHEAAHYAAGHHYAFVKRAAALVLSAGLGAAGAGYFAGKHLTWQNCLCLALVSSGGSYAICEYLLKSYEVEQEFEADRLAAEKLCARDKARAVIMRCNDIEKQLQSTDRQSSWLQKKLTNHLIMMREILERWNTTSSSIDAGLV